MSATATRPNKGRTAFVTMQARFSSKCCACRERILAGDLIYWAKPNAYCEKCGKAHFEPQGELPIADDFEPRAETSLPQAAPAAPAPQPAPSGMPLTLSKCYCHLVKRKCGACVAREMGAGA